MPSATFRRMYEDQLPSFMSVFGLDADNVAISGPDQEHDLLVNTDAKIVHSGIRSPPDLVCTPRNRPQPSRSLTDVRDGQRERLSPELDREQDRNQEQDQEEQQMHDRELECDRQVQPQGIISSAHIHILGHHNHHDSISTRTSESDGSSPTTTYTTDSSPLCEPSPSSPTSLTEPPSLVHLNQYPTASFRPPLPLRMAATATSAVASTMATPYISATSVSGSGSIDSSPMTISVARPLFPSTVAQRPSDISDSAFRTTVSLPQATTPPPPLRLSLSSNPFRISVSTSSPEDPSSIESGLVFDPIAKNALECPVTSPFSRRPRNAKGLSIQPPFSTASSASAASSAGTPLPVIVEPTPPSFIKPVISSMRRKPSLLSLNTNTSTVPLRRNLSDLVVPPSPGLQPIPPRKMPKHSVSTPHMLAALTSCTFGPNGGMTLPNMLERNESGLSEVLRPLRPTSTISPTHVQTTNTSVDIAAIPEVHSPIRPQMASRVQLDQEPYAKDEANEDNKSPCYPDGPIAMYADNVFLYMEPSVKVASDFDVVINVAREVQTPFPNLSSVEDDNADGRDERRECGDEHGYEAGKLFRRGDCLDRASISSPSPSPLPSPSRRLMTSRTRGVTNTATATVTKNELVGLSSPTIHPTSINPGTCTDVRHAGRRPEYIHMLWDHTTNITPDLMALCELIEARTREGKRVLIHCQQGASRSASLVIAYGMYLQPELSVNDAYYAAQAKSRWISPNMKLMYCLQDFQKELSKRRLSPASAYSHRHQRSGRSPAKLVNHRLTLSADAIGPCLPPHPQTAPLPGQDDAVAIPAPVSRSNPSYSSYSSYSSTSSTSSSLSLSATKPSRPRGNSSPIVQQPITPGPSSAPSSLTWYLRTPPRAVLETTPEPVADADAVVIMAGPAPSPAPSTPLRCSPLSVPASVSLPASPSSPTTVTTHLPVTQLIRETQSQLPAKRRLPPARLSRRRVPPPLRASRSLYTLSIPPPPDYFDITLPGLPGSFLDDSALLSPRAMSMTYHRYRDGPVTVPARASTSILGFASARSATESFDVSVGGSPDAGAFSPMTTSLFLPQLMVVPASLSPDTSPFASCATRFLPNRPGLSKELRGGDPRSPATLGTVQIVRSIDELL